MDILVSISSILPVDLNEDGRQNLKEDLEDLLRLDYGSTGVVVTVEVA